MKTTEYVEQLQGSCLGEEKKMEKKMEKMLAPGFIPMWIEIVSFLHFCIGGIVCGLLAIPTLGWSLRWHNLSAYHLRQLEIRLLRVYYHKTGTEW